MRKKTIFTLIFTFIISIFSLMSFNHVYKIKAAEETHDVIFYGAKSIEIPADQIDSNNLAKFYTDPRFSVFAMNEKGQDLTSSIEISNPQGLSTVPGGYTITRTITYEEKQYTYDMSVKVVGDTISTIKVQRIIYSLPSPWNLRLTNNDRKINTDLQITGLYLPKGQSITTHLINKDSDVNGDIKLVTLCDDSSKETTHISTENEVYVANSKSNSALFVQSPISDNASATKIGTSTIELIYDKSNVKELDYYRRNGDIDLFVNKWENSNNDFAVIENEAITMVVPKVDKDKISQFGANPIGNLDDVLDYYKSVIENYDSMLGLDYNSESSLHKNFRTKQTIKADLSNSDTKYNVFNGGSIAKAFQYDFGTLDLLTKGYLGDLGNGGNLYLSNVSDKIMAYYVQSNDSLYKKNDNYLGDKDLSKIEETRNTNRLNSENVFVSSTNEEFIKDKTYALVNLFNKFEGVTTYGKLNKYYRNLANTNSLGTLTMSEIYATFFASVYNADIRAYLSSWSIGIREGVDTTISNIDDLTVYKITADGLTSDEIKTLVDDEYITLKYGLSSSDEITSLKSAAAGSAPILTLTKTTDTIDTVTKEDLKKYATALDNEDGDITNSITIDDSDIDYNTAGTYSVIYSITDSSGKSDSKTLTLTIGKTIQKPTADNTVFTFNNKVQAYGIESNAYYDVANSAKKNVGSYTVTVTLKSGFYTWLDGTKTPLTFNFVINRLLLAKPEADATNRCYTGEDQTYNIPTSDYYTVTNNIQQELGSYIVTVALKDKVNTAWKDSTTNNLEYEFNIIKGVVTKPKEDTNIFSFNGLNQTYNIEQSDDYTISNATQMNIGTYIVIVSLTDKGYTTWDDGTTADLQYTFVITKGQVDKPNKDGTVFYYTGEDQTYTIESNSNYSVSGNVKKSIGTHKVIVSLVDKNNYEWVDGTTNDIEYSFIINKGRIVKPISDVAATIYDGEIHEFITEKAGMYTVTNNLQSEVGNYKVTVSLVDKEHYTWNDGSIDDVDYNFVIAKAQYIKPKVDTTEHIYSGEPITYGIDNNPGYDIIDNVQTNAGEYKVKVVLKDKNNCEWSDGTIDDLEYDFIINKFKVSKPKEDAKTFYSDGTINNTYEIDDSIFYTISGELSKTEPGDTNITISLKDKDNSEWKDSTTDDLNYVFSVILVNVDTTNNSVTVQTTSDKLSNGLNIDEVLKLAQELEDSELRIVYPVSNNKNATISFDITAINKMASADTAQVLKAQEITELNESQLEQYGSIHKLINLLQVSVSSTTCTAKISYPIKGSSVSGSANVYVYNSSGELNCTEVEVVNGYIEFTASKLSTFAFAFGTNRRIVRLIVISSIVVTAVIAYIIFYIVWKKHKLKIKRDKIFSKTTDVLEYLNEEYPLDLMIHVKEGKDNDD